MLCSAEGVIVQAVPSEDLRDLLMFRFFDGRNDNQGFESLCPVDSAGRATQHTNIIVSVTSRNVNCGIFQSIRRVHTRSDLWFGGLGVM